MSTSYFVFLPTLPRYANLKLFNLNLLLPFPPSCIFVLLHKCPRVHRWSRQRGTLRPGRTSSHGSPPSCLWCAPPPSCLCGSQPNAMLHSHVVLYLYSESFRDMSHLILSTVKDPSFMPRASWAPSTLKDTLRTASSMLQRAMRAWSTRLHNLKQRDVTKCCL